MQHRQENTIVWAAGEKAAEMMDRYFGECMFGDRENLPHTLWGKMERYYDRRWGQIPGIIPDYDILDLVFCVSPGPHTLAEGVFLCSIHRYDPDWK